MKLSREPIKPITKTKTVDNNMESLGPCWLELESHEIKAEEIIKGANRTFILAGPDKKLMDHLVEIINQAKDMICVSTFLIQESWVIDSLLKAANRGVNVYLLTAREEELNKLEEDMREFEKQVILEHKELLNSLAGKILVRTAPHFHAKFLLIDPKSEDCKGFLMTCNATIDAMIGKNLEIGLTLNPEEVKSFFSQFIQGFWLESRHELFQKGELNEVGKMDYFKPEFAQQIHPSTIGNKTLSLKKKIVDIISNTKNNIIINGWSFEKDHEVTKALLKKVDDGVKISVYSRPKGHNTNALLDLAKKECSIYGHDRFHVKSIISDDKYGLIMTSNFTKKGLNSGFEAGIEIKDEDLSIISDLSNRWKNCCSWDLKSEVIMKDATSNVKQFKKEGNSNIINDVTIEKSIEKNLGSIIADSIENMNVFQPNFPELNTDSQKFRSVSYKWTVNPPLLPEQAKPVEEEVEEEVTLTKEETNEYKKKNIKDIPKTKIIKEFRPILKPFPLYKTKKNKYVVIKYLDEIQKAKQFAKEYDAKLVISQII